ncbi:hypothetical protein JCM10908_005627 [Rhodotorula pacifica]|uniref:uncharacterized protein n=1 Tax=Rhodotorula pacifica TaxID=1495444 RepID=UPI00317DB0F1
MSTQTPPQLDYARSTYFVLSSSSPAPPPLPSSSSNPPLRYVGPVGQGIMADEHIVALEGIPSGSAAAAAAGQVERAKEVLMKVEGVKSVEVMQPKQRAKR